MTLILRQSTAVDVLIGPFVDEEDGVTPLTSLTISQGEVLLSKNGQALTQKNDNTAASHDAGGYYNCELDATDTNTVGTLVLIVNEAGALPVRHEFQIIEENVYDALYASGADLGTTVDAILTDTGTTLDGKLDTIDGIVDAILVDTGTAIPGLIGALNDVTASDVASAVWSQAVTEPSGPPAFGTGTALQLLAWLGALSLNKIVQTASAQALRNAADNSDIATADVSDDGTTFARDAWE